MEENKSNRQTVSMRITIVVAVLLLLVPALGSLYRLLDGSDAARVSVVKKESELEWPQALDQWYRHHFYGHKWLAWMAAKGRYSLGMEPNKDAVIGRDGRLFLTRNNVIEQSRGADGLHRDELDALVALLKQKQQFWRDRGVHWLHMVAPGKPSVYRDQLPARFALTGPSRLTQYLAALQAAGISDLDLLSLMRQHRQSAMPIYPLTDSHWTCYGAYLVYEALMDALEQQIGKPFKRVSGSELQFFRVDHPGDIAKNIFGLGESVRELRGVSCRYPARQARAWNHDSGELLEVATVPTTKLGQLQSTRFHTANALNQQRVVVVRDSYVWPLQPLLNLTFSDVLYVYHWHLRPLETYLESFQPDIVIYEYTDRALYLPVQHWREHGRFLPPLG